MTVTAEILQTLEHVRATLDDLCIRGLRSAGSEQINTLTTLEQEFERIGAAHVASRLGTVIRAVRSGGHDGPKHVMRAQASVRLFERILTLSVAEDALKRAVEEDTENHQSE